MLRAGSSVHVIGGCGTAMATLCAMLAERGHRVRASDADVYPPMSDVLRERGIPLASPYAAANLDPAPDLVVVGNAIPRDNEEMAAVLDRGLPFLAFPELLRQEFLQGRHSVVISGTHGKTTTTAMACVAAVGAGLDPSALVGGYVHDLGGSHRLGAGEAFLLEGDEYDTAWFDKRPKFLHYFPRTLVVGNLEFDHADIYASLEEIELQFRRLVALVPGTGRVLVGDASERATAVVEASRAPIERFGLATDSCWRAVEIEDGPGGASFTLLRAGEPLGRVAIPFSGEHNVRNATAALAVTLSLGGDLAGALTALETMSGIRRRLELRGEVAGVLVYDDFAHHPTAIAETLRAVAARHPGQRTWALFEPRSWTARRNVHQATLPDALGLADHVVLAPVFEPERLAADVRLDVERVVADLRQRGVDAVIGGDAAAIAALVAERAADGDVVVVMSNGSFGGVHDLLLERLRA